MSTKELTTGEAAARLGESPRLVRLWCKQGRFPGARLVEHPRGDYYLIPAREVDNFVKPKRGPAPKASKTAPSPDGRVIVKKAAKRRGGKAA